MSNTYSQLYTHYVFVVQNRLSLIQIEWEEILFKYLSGIVEKQGHKVYAINGIPDHVHIFVSMNPKQSPSELVFNAKRSSSLWINEKRLSLGKFSWQEGFAAFSYGKSQVDSVVKYIKGQKEHHHKKTFNEEYLEFLKLYGIEYNEKYIFKPVNVDIKG